MKWSFSLAALCLLLQIPRLPCEEKLLLEIEKQLAPDPVEPCKIRRHFNGTQTTASPTSNPRVENPKSVPRCEMKFSARLPAIYFFFSLPVIYCQDRILSDVFQRFAEETSEREGSFFRKPTRS
ncbi:hypothetical protein QR680_009996 [Steinernema hermaphroditum]|uniref:Uncharacterized protein n=1 Tax=Steinernema hermaphroditum TaxID=289476 RepID=A0AA39INQ2_9BILA|nr:hypothetical protein QR680_009996 [Steinernema hermaphroditum]